MDRFIFMELKDLIDILLTSVIFYYAIKFIRERRAGKLAVGMGVMVLLQIVGVAFHLPVISFLMQNLFQVGIIAMIILFQPELRSALEKLGGVQVGGIRGIIGNGDAAKQREQFSKMVEDICTAVCDLSLDKTGALIVFERTTKLGEYIRSGTVINADITARMVKNIFFNKAPLHDGALIVREDRLYAAGCFLPLSTGNDINRDLGTRHRAAIGMSENSDAIVVVVSEETGTISLAKAGELHREYDYRTLYNELMEELSPNRVSMPVSIKLKKSEQQRDSSDADSQS